GTGERHRTLGQGGRSGASAALAEDIQKRPEPFGSRAHGSLDPWSRLLDLHDVRRAGSLGAVHDLETHAVTLVERAESLSPDLRVMHEDVRPTLTGEETETLRLVEPLHRTFDHERAGLLSLA